MSGEGAFSRNKGQNQNAANFSQGVWQPQGDALQGFWTGVQGMFDNNQTGNQQQADSGRQFNQALMGDQRGGMQDALGGGVYKDMGLQNNLMDSLNASQNKESNMQSINNMIMGGKGNNYADAMKNNFIQDADRAQQLMLGNLDARASAAGMSGGARQGVAQAQGMRDINQNLQQNMGNVGYQSFNKDLDRKLNIAQQADQNTFGRQQLMSNMLGNMQNTQNQGMGYGQGLYGQGVNNQNMPWQQAGQMGNIIGRPTVLGSGSASGSGNSKGFATSGGGGMMPSG